VYIYMTVGTVLVFTIFGYSLGRRSDQAVDETDTVKEELQQVNELAITDALTGLHNARFLHDDLSRELETARRYRTPVACAMLDIDDFKRINDTHGHPFGDAVLSTLAKIIGECVRQVDIVGRLGGEEFLVIMPHTTLELGMLVAERIRKAVQQSSFTFENTTASVTISLGVACFPSKEISDKNGLLKTVDNALYQAKRTGKNRTVSFRSDICSRDPVKAGNVLQATR
jgi:two-component system cell cycle response regulator